VLVHGTGHSPRHQRRFALPRRFGQVLADQRQQVKVRRQAELAEFGHGFAFVLQQALGQVPAAVQRANQLAFRDFDCIEEHLAERRFAADQINRRNAHPGAFHVEHDQADARVLAGGGIGADQRIHPVRLVSVRGPDFAAINYKMIASIPGGGFQARQVRAGIGLGEALAPAHFTASHRGEQVFLLRFAAELQQHRAKHPDAQIDLWRAALQAAQLTFEHGVIFRAQPCTAIFGRPVRAEPALVAHALKPQLGIGIGELDIPCTPHQLAFRNRLALGGWTVGLKPAAGLLSELVNGVHVISPVNKDPRSSCRAARGCVRGRSPRQPCTLDVSETPC